MNQNDAMSQQKRETSCGWVSPATRWTRLNLQRLESVLNLIRKFATGTRSIDKWKVLTLDFMLLRHHDY